MEDMLDGDELPGLDVMEVDECVDGGARTLRSRPREGNLC